MGEQNIGGQSQKTTDLISQIRERDATLTPYQRVCMEASGDIRVFASRQIESLKPWDPKRPVTVVEGKPKYTAESHAQKYAPARRNLEHLVQALAAPDDMDLEFARSYNYLLLAIFALKEPDRERLCGEFKEVLNTYPAKAG